MDFFCSMISGQFRVGPTVIAVQFGSIGWINLTITIEFEYSSLGRKLSHWIASFISDGFFSLDPLIAWCYQKQKQNKKIRSSKNK